MRQQTAACAAGPTTWVMSGSCCASGVIPAAQRLAQSVRSLTAVGHVLRYLPLHGAGATSRLRWYHCHVVYKLRVGQKGRTVLPAGLRASANIREGDTLVARLEAGRVILESSADVKGRIRAAAAEAMTDGRVVDRLLQERRREAEADDARLAQGAQTPPG